MMRVARRKVSSERARAAAFVVLCVFLAATSAAGASLEDYRSRVHKAMIAVDAHTASTGESDTEFEAETFAEVRRLLPATEKVEHAGGTTIVNNEWLHRALDDYEKSTQRLSAEERAASLTRIAERLHALEARLAESVGGAADKPRDKDAEKGRLASILRGKEYNREAAEGGALQRLLRQIFEWVADLFPNVRPLQPGRTGRLSPVAQYVILALAVALIAFILWKYWLRRRNLLKTTTPKEARIVLGEHLAPEVTVSDLLTEAELLAREGNLRGAIRKAYIALLCELGDRKIIRLAQHNTNRDYLRAVRKTAPPQLYEEMQPLTSGFERHWYGLEEADQSDWADFRTRCRQALSVK